MIQGKVKEGKEKGFGFHKVIMNIVTNHRALFLKAAVIALYSIIIKLYNFHPLSLSFLHLPLNFHLESSLIFQRERHDSHPSSLRNRNGPDNEFNFQGGYRFHGLILAGYRMFKRDRIYGQLAGYPITTPR